MRIKLTGFAIAAYAMAAASTASAQTTDTDLDRAEARRERPEPAERGLAGVRSATDEAEKHFTLSFALPFTFNSNVAGVQTGANSAFHADPTISLEGSWTSGSANFFVEASADDDNYTSYSDNNGATLYGRAGVRFGDATTRIAPYLHYTFIGLYSGHFESHAVSTHYFTLGAKRTYARDDHNQRFTIDANILRREATVAEVEQVRGTFLLSLGQSFDRLNKDTRWSLSGRAQYAWYTGGTADGREDLTLRVAAGLSHAVSPSLTLEAQVYFQRNWSNRPGKDYSVWDAGPTITLSTAF